MRGELLAEQVSLADGLSLQAFMLQICLELGRDKPDPATWARAFVDELYLRLDGTGYVDPIRDIARARVDRLERRLSELMAQEAQSIRE